MPHAVIIPTFIVSSLLGMSGCSTSAATRDGSTDSTHQTVAAVATTDRSTDSNRHEATAIAPTPFDKPGFETVLVDGRLWVFREGSAELSQFRSHGELAKHVIRPAGGPAGMTIKAPDQETILAYQAAQEGFVTRLEDGRVWVFEPGSKALADFESHGELAKHVIRPGAGPGGMTVKAPDTEVLQRYLYAKPGFVTAIEDGRLWVFRQGSGEWQQFQSHGELAKHVIRPGGGPGGMTIKAPDQETIRDYLVMVPGFETRFEDGRLWVFRVGSKELAAFEAHGELAKHVIRPGAGPGGMTIKSPDTAVLDRYLAAIR